MCVTATTADCVVVATTTAAPAPPPPPLLGRATQVIILANADIFFDKNLSRLAPFDGDVRDLNLENQVFALLRWEWTLTTAAPNTSEATQSGSATAEEADVAELEQGVGIFHARVDSQDAWVWRSPLPASLLPEANFYLGLPRCDNRVAQVGS